jgi:hypothetical protein
MSITSRLSVSSRTFELDTGCPKARRTGEGLFTRAPASVGLYDNTAVAAAGLDVAGQ